MPTHGDLGPLNSNMSYYKEYSKDIPTFVRIQRSGSTSLQNSQERGKTTTFNTLEHGYCFKVNDLFHSIFPNSTRLSKEYFYFDRTHFSQLYALIRNPFDILISYYTHNWNECNQIHNFNSWEDFIEAYINSNFQWHLPPMKKSMLSMIYDEHDTLIIKRYFKIENLNNINNFLHYHNCPPLEKLNTSIREQKQYYTPNQVDKLNKIWERDLKYFNYKYEGQ